MNSLTVEGVMTRHVFALAPDTSLLTASRLFAAKHISGAPVVDPTGKAVGVVTQSDLVDPDRNRTRESGRAMYYSVIEGKCEPIGDGLPSSHGVVADVMSPYVLCVESGWPLMQAIRLMVNDSVHRLLVVHDDRLVGIVTSMDILRALARLADDDRRTR